MQLINSKGDVVGYTRSADPTLVLLISKERTIRVPKSFMNKERETWFFLHVSTDGKRELIGAKAVMEDGYIDGDDYVYNW